MANKAVLKERIKGIDRAVVVANKELSRRLKGMNEIREQLTAQASQFATMDRVKALEQRVQELRESGAAVAGRQPIITEVLKIGGGALAGYLLFQLTH